MVFPTKFAYNPMEEMATLKDFPDFRFFATARSTSPTPLWDLATEGVTCDAQPCDRWLTVEQATAVQPGKLPKSPLPNTFLANFSAVCFLTVRDIARMHTSKRPMAMIQSAWGGTRVEACESLLLCAVSAWAYLERAEPPLTQCSLCARDVQRGHRQGGAARRVGAADQERREQRLGAIQRDGRALEQVRRASGAVVPGARISGSTVSPPAADSNPECPTRGDPPRAKRTPTRRSRVWI